MEYHEKVIIFLIYTKLKKNQKNNKQIETKNYK